VVFEVRDVPADGPVRNAKLVRRAANAQEPRDRLERAQGIERRGVSGADHPVTLSYQ
jgi:hypothetical protein